MTKLDQFYTQDIIASICGGFIIKKIPNRGRYIYLEPSAGEGAFYRFLPSARRIGIDLDPKMKGIRKGNFFKYRYVGGRRVIVIGNPPFGKNSSIAIQFFNHAASMPKVEYIAFIVPKTFRKTSVQNRLSMDFRLIAEVPLPDNSFVKDGEPYSVPCTFQIWQRTATKRIPVQVNLNNEWFDFVKKDEKPDLAVRRVGFNAGACKTDVNSCKTTTFYFLRLKPTMNKTNFHVYVNSLKDSNKFLSVIGNTAGPRSLSKGEFVEVLRANPFFI